MSGKRDNDKFFFAYGGDFTYLDTAIPHPHDYNFVMDGLCLSDHSAGRGLLEYKKAIEVVQVLSTEASIQAGQVSAEIINRYDVLTLDHLTCWASFLADNGESLGDEIPIPIPPQLVPHSKGIITVPVPDRTATLTVSFRLSEATLWATANHEVAWGQVTINVKSLPRIITTTGSLQISQSKHILHIGASASQWVFDTASGNLTSWLKSGREILATAPKMNFYRPLTDNDRLGPDGKDWLSKRVHQTDVHLLETVWDDEVKDGKFSVTVKSRIAPPVLEWCVHTTTRYTFRADGSVEIMILGAPEGRTLPRTWARIGVLFEINTTTGDVEWYGLGPMESYPDKGRCARLGVWKMSIDDMSNEWKREYEYPQEGGARGGVRWVSVGGVRTTFPRPGHFTISRYPFPAIDAATHQFALHPHKLPGSTLLRLDSAMHGVGTASCGPGVLEEYQLKVEPFKWEARME